MDKKDCQKEIAKSLLKLKMELPLISTITNISIFELQEINKNIDL